MGVAAVVAAIPDEERISMETPEGVMPRMNLRRLGLVDMQEALRTGAAERLQNLLGIALPSTGEDDPLRKLAERALAEGD
jgi:hypothetical protein